MYNKMDPLLYVFNSGKLASHKTAPHFLSSARMCLMCYCPSIEYHRLSMCVFFFFSLYASFIPAGWLSLSLFSYIQLLHISTQTDRQHCYFLFFLSFELCIYSNVTYYRVLLWSFVDDVGVCSLII